MPWCGYLIVFIVAWLACMLVTYLFYCAYLQRGKKSLVFAGIVICLNVLTFYAVKLYKKFTGRRLWWDKMYDPDQFAKKEDYEPLPPDACPYCAARGSKTADKEMNLTFCKKCGQVIKE